MADPHCIACEGVGQVALTREIVIASAQRLPQWLLDAVEDAYPLPLILNCPRCGAGKSAIRGVAMVDFDEGGLIVPPARKLILGDAA